MKNIKRLVSKNFGGLLFFELLYKIITLAIVSPLFMALLKVDMYITGFNYLTMENIGAFLLQPLTLILIFVSFVFLSAYSLFDILTVIIFFDQSHKNRKVVILDVIKTALRKLKQIMHFRNTLLFVFVLFFVPLISIGFASGLITSINIPGFIMDYIYDNIWLSILFAAFICVGYYFSLRWLYTIHYMALDDENLKPAVKKSINLSRGHIIKDFFTILITQIICVLIYLAILAILLLLTYVIAKFLSFFILFQSALSTVVVVTLTVLNIILVLIAVPINYAIISSLFYEHQHKKRESLNNLEINLNSRRLTRRKIRFIIYVCSGVALISGTFYAYQIYTGRYNYDIEYTRNVEVTAHRGDSANYPENTMSAFVGAKKLNADWIELDVQQSKDGQIFVMHDGNFYRTTGVDSGAWELNYDDISKLDAGSYFSSEFAGEKIPLLSEVIKFAKDNNIRLNIELKPTGHETDFEKTVIDIINKNDFVDRCVLTSLSYDVLENIKQYDSRINTVYVMSLAYGDINELSYADGFSIEATSISTSITSEAHSASKKVYAWTVNSVDEINNMISYNVDNIVTNDIATARETIDYSKTSNLFKEYFKFINVLFDN